MADASASFELESDPLSAGLDAIAAKFSAVSSQISATFSGASQQLNITAAAANGVGATAPAISTAARALALVTASAASAGAALASIAVNAARVATFARYIPDSLGPWVPRLKEVAEAHSDLANRVLLVKRGYDALTGELGILGAIFTGIELRELGASKAASIFGGAAALALSKTITLAGIAAGAVSRVGSAFAAAGRGIAGAFASAGRGIASAASIFSPLLGMALTLGPIGAAAVGVAGGFALIKKSVVAASDLQGPQRSFLTLLGTADAARARMAELSKFIGGSTFELPQVAKASQDLQTLTKGALASGAGLRLVGDAATVTGKPIEHIADIIGHAYQALMSGKGGGEALRQLVNLGLVTDASRNKIEALQKQGASGGDVWTVAAVDLMRYSGEMDRQSNTWQGWLRRIGQEVSQLFPAFGAPLLAGLTPFMARWSAWMETLIPWAQRAGAIFAGWSALIAQIFADGQLSQALSVAGKVGFLEATNVLLGAFTGLGNVLFAMLTGGARAMGTMLSAYATADFWKGLANALKSAAAGLGAILLEAVAKLLDALATVPGIGKKAAAAAEAARNTSAELSGTSSDAAGSASNSLAPLFSRLSDDFRATMKDAGEKFKEGNKLGSGLIDTSGAMDELHRFIAPIARRAQDAVDAAAKAAEKGGLPVPTQSDDVAGAGGKKGDGIASLQKIGGGGNFSMSAADPLLTETKAQTREIEGMRAELKQLREQLANRNTARNIEAVFG